MHSGPSCTAIFRSIGGASRKKDGEEASAQLESIPHRGSFGLGKVGKSDHLALKYPAKILEGSENAHEVVPHPFPSSVLEFQWGEIRVLRGHSPFAGKEETTNAKVEEEATVKESGSKGREKIIENPRSLSHLGFK